MARCRMFWLIARLIALSVLFLVAVPVAGAARELDVALWQQVRTSQLAQINGVWSGQMSYTATMDAPDDMRKRTYAVDLKFEGGLPLNADTYAGKSYQKTRTWLVGFEDQHNAVVEVEQASLGGAKGEIRSRDPVSDRVLRLGVKGRDPLLSCPTPGNFANYDTLEMIASGRLQTTLMGITRDGDRVVVRVRSGMTGAIIVLSCDSKVGYLPEKIEAFVPEESEEVPFKTTYITYAPVTTPDGSRLFCPASGRITFEGSDVTSEEWAVDLDTLKLNEDVPDATFYLTPREDESVMRASDFKIVRRAKRPAPREAAQGDSAAAAVADPAGDGRSAAERAINASRNAGAASAWWVRGAQILGGVLILVPVLIWIRSKQG